MFFFSRVSYFFAWLCCVYEADVGSLARAYDRHRFPSLSHCIAIQWCTHQHTFSHGEVFDTRSFELSKNVKYKN